METLKQVIGLLLISSPIIAMFILGWWSCGLKTTIKTFLAVAVIMAMVVAGVMLITN